MDSLLCVHSHHTLSTVHPRDFYYSPLRRFYTPELHQAAFVVPKFAEDVIKVPQARAFSHPTSGRTGRGTSVCVSERQTESVPVRAYRVSALSTNACGTYHLISSTHSMFFPRLQRLRGRKSTSRTTAPETLVGQAC